MNDARTLVQNRLGRNSWGLLGTQGFILGLDIGGFGLRTALVDLHSHSYTAVHREVSAANAGAAISRCASIARSQESISMAATPST